MWRMKILALETATHACSVALRIDGVTQQRHAIAPREHAQRVLPDVHDLLTEAGITLNQLDAIAVGRGPGSFTGVRIAIGIAQGLAFGAELPLVPVSSLAALAQTAADECAAEHVIAAFDARMQELYCACYVRQSHGLVELMGEEQVAAAADVPLPSQGQWLAAGDGWENYDDILQARCSATLTAIHPNTMPQAQAVTKLAEAALHNGGGLPPAQVLPVYLRNNVATPKIV